MSTISLLVGPYPTEDDLEDTEDARPRLALFFHPNSLWHGTIVWAWRAPTPARFNFRFSLNDSVWSYHNEFFIFLDTL